jgi:hypothetical protein
MPGAWIAMSAPNLHLAWISPGAARIAYRVNIAE